MKHGDVLLNELQILSKVLYSGFVRIEDLHKCLDQTISYMLGHAWPIFGYKRVLSIGQVWTTCGWRASWSSASTLRLLTDNFLTRGISFNAVEVGP